MLRVALLNWKNKNYDRDFSKFLEAIASPGVISWLNIVGWVLQPGRWFVQVTRASLDTFYCYVENTAEITVDVTWTKKVWLELKQANIDDGTLNAPDGSWVVELKTGASYPASNFLKIAGIVSGVVTDERESLAILWSILNLTSLIQNIITSWDITAGDFYGDEFHTPTWWLQSQINTINVNWVASSWFANSDLVAWEAITKWESLFPEVCPTFLYATGIANIGDTSANTRYEFPIIGTWLPMTTINLWLKKFVSPSVDLKWRFENDNLWSPSWTLFAWTTETTIATSWLTTSIVDKTITLAQSITIPLWVKVRFVLYAWVYGSETINWTNYFWVAYSANDTTTRWRKLWNWSTHSAVATNVRTYVSGAWIQDTVLSKTDADFIYKLPDNTRIAKENYNLWDIVRYDFLGISKTLTSLITNRIYYASNTPGALSLTPGTNVRALWFSISSNELNISQFAVPWLDFTLVSLPTWRSVYYVAPYTKFKSTTILKAWFYRVQFTLYSSLSVDAYSRIYKNWIAYGTERITNNTTTVWTEDLYFNAWDTCEIWGKWWCSWSWWAQSISAFKISYNLNDLAVIGNLD